MASETTSMHQSTASQAGQHEALSSLSDQELKQEAVDSYREATAGGTLHYTLWATLRAGRHLLELKRRCQHGEFSAIKEAEGLNAMQASRFMRLAGSPNLTHCVNYRDCQEAIDRNEWRSMRKVLEAHELVSPPSPAKVEEPVSDIEVEEVELCRHSGGYLVRVSAGTDPQRVAQRVEFASGTNDPGIARLIRDAVYRGFDAVGILPPRSKAKWQAYKEQESAISGLAERLEEASRIIAGYQSKVAEFSMAEEFGPAQEQGLAFLNAA